MVGIGKVQAKNTASYWTYGFDEERFGEETLVRKAVNIAVNRIQEERIWKNAYEVAALSFVTDEAMANSNLIDNQANRWNLLWHQLYYLSQPNGDEDTEPAFPHIHVRAGYEKNGHWLGRANTNLVTIRKANGRVQQSGSFDITLNRYYLASGGTYSDPEEWASTIAHEMLHNLGHLHPRGADALSDRYQINALNNAVLSNGHQNWQQNWKAISNRFCWDS